MIMANMNYESKNTVKAEGQMNFHVFIDGEPDGSPRIMIMGNSITKHAPAPQIGWYGNWGMAASSEDKDYAHRLIAKVRERCPRATFCIVQAAVWEVDYNLNMDEYFSEAKAFCPDVIVCAISANIKDAVFEHDSFIENMGKLHDYLGYKDGETRLIQTSSFFNNERKSEAIRDYVAKRGGDYIYISDLPSDSTNLAIGLFDHDGVAHHPSDKGMAEMADRIFERLKIYI